MKCLNKITLVVALLVIAMSASAVTPGILKNVDRRAMDKWVNTHYKKMSFDDKIAQLMVYTVNPVRDAKAAVDENVAKYHLGGIIYSESSMLQEASVTNYAQSLSPVPLLITLDGEWGLGMRMSDSPSFPKNMALGAVADEKLLYDYGREVAREFKLMGIQVNFAPVLDVNDNPANPVIYRRSFGETPDIVASRAITYARGLEDGGVLSVGKHFPGHGSTATDSHKTLPTVTKSLAELSKCEFVPFTKYIDSSLSGMLTAHLSVPAVDSSDLPASMSPKCVTDLLQKQMGFEGLIFTDALEMKGAKVSGSRCVQALLAGNDILLSPQNVAAEIDSVKIAVKKGILKKSDIENRCKKVLSFKYALGLADYKPVDEATVVAQVNSPASLALTHRLAAASMTVAKNDGNILPLRHLDTNSIAVLSLGTYRGVNTDFQKRCEMYSHTGKFSFTPGADINILLKRLAPYSTVVVGVYADDAPYQEVMDSLVARCANVVPVFFLKPYAAAKYAAPVAKAKAVVMAWDDSALAEDYAAQAVYGGISPQGKMPISISGLASVGTGFTYAATRLGFSVPEEAGLDSRMLARIDSIVNIGLKTESFPGCQVLVAKNGKVVCDRSYGVIDTESGIPVTDNTIYDLASVSKATGTLPGIMKAVDKGLIRVDEKASAYIPALLKSNKKDLTLRQLLFHETGIQPSLNMYEVMIDKKSYHGEMIGSSCDATCNIKINDRAFGNKDARLRTDITSPVKSARFPIMADEGIYVGRAAYDTIMSRVYQTKLRPDRNYVYSCLNFCLLMNVEENVTHEHHNDFVTENFYAPLGSWHITYRPLEKFDKSMIAPTEYDTFMRRQLVWGTVHDETANFSGGVQGNAGLFSNATDLAKLCQMWLNGGTYGGDRLLSEATVNLFTTTKSPNSRRGLGFDKPNKADEENSPTCAEAPGETYGHLGFTGTVFWVDPKNDIVFIFLCNRVYPTRENEAFSDLDIRPKLFSIVYNSFLNK